MTRDTLLSNDKDRKLEYRVILEAHADIVKDPNAVERGRRDGMKAQQNRQKLVEFKGACYPRIFIREPMHCNCSILL